MATMESDFEQKAVIFTDRLRKGNFRMIFGINCIFSQAFARLIAGTGQVAHKSGDQF